MWQRICASSSHHNFLLLHSDECNSPPDSLRDNFPPEPDTTLWCLAASPTPHKDRSLAIGGRRLANMLRRFQRRWTLLRLLAGLEVLAAYFTAQRHWGSAAFVVVADWRLGGRASYTSCTWVGCTMQRGRKGPRRLERVSTRCQRCFEESQEFFLGDSEGLRKKFFWF